jgi:hypothetical protein
VEQVYRALVPNGYVPINDDTFKGYPDAALYDRFSGKEGATPERTDNSSMEHIKKNRGTAVVEGAKVHPLIVRGEADTTQEQPTETTCDLESIVEAIVDKRACLEDEKSTRELLITHGWTVSCKYVHGMETVTYSRPTLRGQDLDNGQATEGIDFFQSWEALSDFLLRECTKRHHDPATFLGEHVECTQNYSFDAETVLGEIAVAVDATAMLSDEEDSYELTEALERQSDCPTKTLDLEKRPKKIDVGTEESRFEEPHDPMNPQELARSMNVRSFTTSASYVEGSSKADGIGTRIGDHLCSRYHCLRKTKV